MFVSGQSQQFRSKYTIYKALHTRGPGWISRVEKGSQNRRQTTVIELEMTIECVTQVFGPVTLLCIQEIAIEDFYINLYVLRSMNSGV